MKISSYNHDYELKYNFQDFKKMTKIRESSDEEYITKNVL